MKAPFLAFSWWTRPVAGWVLAAAVLALLFGPSLSGYFLGHDFGYVGLYTNASLEAWPRLFVTEWSQGIWGFPLPELRPFAALSFILNAQLGEPAPWIYRLTNLGLHAGCVGLVMSLTRAYLPRASLAPLAAGLWFALHPVHLESVVWVTGRVEVLVALFYLSAVRTHVAYRQGAGAGWGAATGALFAVAVFSKESGLTFPLMLIGLDALCHREAWWRRGGWRTFWPYLGLAVVLVLYAFCRRQALGAEPVGVALPPLDEAGLASWWQRQSLYLNWLLPAFGEGSGPGLRIWLALAGSLGLLAAIAWWERRVARAGERGRLVFFGLWWYVVATLPLLMTYVSARHLYLASAGLCVAVGLLWAGLEQRRPRVALGVLALVVLASGWELSLRLQPWREAAARSQALAEEVRRLGAQLAAGDVLLIDAPESHRGVPLWAWSCPFVLRPPFMAEALDRRLVILTRPGAYFHLEKWHEPDTFARLRAAAERGAQGAVLRLDAEGRVWTETVEAARLREPLTALLADPTPPAWPRLLDALRP